MGFCRPAWASSTPDESSVGCQKDWNLAGKAIPKGTTLELLNAKNEQPFSPPIRTAVPPDAQVEFLLPPGVDRFAARTTLGKGVTYQHSRTFARGAPFADFKHAPPEATQGLASRVGVDLFQGAEHLWGYVTWGREGEHHESAPVGCAVVTLDADARVFYGSPDEPKNRFCLTC